MENRLSELFPIQSIGPLLGGVLIWFVINYLYIGPELIGPRLAAKYYLPACMAAVKDGRTAFQEETTSLQKAFAVAQQKLADELRGQMQQGATQLLGTIFGGRPGSEAFFKQHGSTLQGWANNMAGAGLGVIGDRLQAQKAEFNRGMAEREKEARKGVIYPAPAQYCSCVVGEGLKERVDLAAFTSTLRLYTPPAIRRLSDGTMLHEARACGTMPTV